MARLSSQEIMNVLLSHLEIILRKKGKVRTLTIFTVPTRVSLLVFFLDFLAGNRHGLRKGQNIIVIFTYKF